MPFQAAEAIAVRHKSDKFGEKLDSYRSLFLQKAPFTSVGNDLTLEIVRKAFVEALSQCSPC